MKINRPLHSSDAVDFFCNYKIFNANTIDLDLLILINTNFNKLMVCESLKTVFTFFRCNFLSKKKIGKKLHNLENILDLYKIPQNALKTPIFQLRLVISVVFFYTYILIIMGPLRKICEKMHLRGYYHL